FLRLVVAAALIFVLIVALGFVAVFALTLLCDVTFAAALTLVLIFVLGLLASFGAGSGGRYGASASRQSGAITPSSAAGRRRRAVRLPRSHASRAKAR